MLRRPPRSPRRERPPPWLPSRRRAAAACSSSASCTILSLAPGAPRTEVCRCLAVAYGAPSDGKFVWQAGTPATDHDTIAIAIAADGVSCASGAPLGRASISAIEREGTDIVVVVENVGLGRPIMRGALTPSPGPNGAIVVRTRHDTPYPAASGPGPCRIALK